jgi:hypothetical protein
MVVINFMSLGPASAVVYMCSLCLKLFIKKVHTHKPYVFIQGVSETGGHILFMCSLEQKQEKNINILCFLGKIVFELRQL